MSIFKDILTGADNNTVAIVIANNGSVALNGTLVATVEVKN